MGHLSGQKCDQPIYADSFVVLDLTGLHEVSVWFCGCQETTAAHVQLLRRYWFPATPKDPCVAATFRLLEQFDVLSGQSTLSASEYYCSLERLTDSMGINPSVVRHMKSHFHELSCSPTRPELFACPAVDGQTVATLEDA